MNNDDIIRSVMDLNKEYIAATNGMEVLLKTIRFMIGLALVSTLITVVVLIVCIFNMKNTRDIVNELHYENQTYIIDTDNKIKISEVDGYNGDLSPYGLEDNVNASMRYCSNEDIVYFSGNDVSVECSNIERYDLENYNH